MATKTALIVIAILIGLSASIERCNKDCKNYIMLKNNNIELEGNYTVLKAQITTFPSSVTVHVLMRKIWRHITTGQQGGVTKVKEVGPYPPDEIESAEWILKSKCKIGSLCVPYGDCYGGGIQHCTGLGLNPSWVEKRDMEFDNTLWVENILFFSERCIQDWSCSIRKKESLVYVDDFGKPFINLGGKRIFLYEEEYNVDKGVVFLLKNIPNKLENIEEMDCIQSNGGFWCNWKNFDAQLSVEFKDLQKCVQMRNFNICPFANRKIRSVKENSITIDDAKELEFEVSKTIMMQNANNIKLQNEIYKLKNVINKIILSMSRYNPFVIKDLIGQNVYVQKKGLYMSACPCNNLDNDCILNSKIHDGDSNCFIEEKAKEIDIIQLSKIIEVAPDDIDFRGKEEDVFETEIEKEDSLNKHFVNNIISDDDSFFKNILSVPGFSFFASIITILPFINFVLIFVRR